jgi:response regulator RpfG family c-di-GMP phosphodiesterase
MELRNNIFKQIKSFFSGDKTMTEVTKPVNYTDAMVQQMVLQYTGNPTPDTVAVLSKEFNKTTRSIVAKLVREGVYIAQVRVTKTGAPVIRKAEIVSQIQELLGVDMPTLEKASKYDLESLLCSITTMSER